jgi:hypothetical protein
MRNRRRLIPSLGNERRRLPKAWCCHHNTVLGKKSYRVLLCKAKELRLVVLRVTLIGDAEYMSGRRATLKIK